MADRINEIIARYENITATAYRPPYEPTQILHNYTRQISFFFLLRLLLVPLRHAVLNGPYQAAQITSDKTFGKRYVVRISQAISTSVLNMKVIISSYGEIVRCQVMRNYFAYV